METIGYGGEARKKDGERGGGESAEVERESAPRAGRSLDHPLARETRLISGRNNTLASRGGRGGEQGIKSPDTQLALSRLPQGGAPASPAPGKNSERDGDRPASQL